METTSIKLYSLNYNDTKTYLATLLFVVGNMALPQLFHLIPQGGITGYPSIFFTLIGAYKYGWKVGVTDSISIAYFKLIIVRHAPTGDLTRHTLKIDTSSDSCRLCSPPLQTHFHPYPPPGRVILSGGRHFRRMDPCQRFFQCRTGFPYRSAGNGSANIRRLSVYKSFDL